MTESEIQAIIQIDERRWGHEVYVPNVYLFKWESDMISINKHGYTWEYEIKCTRADFKADFKKESKHYALELGVMIDPLNGPEIAFRPNRFIYVCPEGLIKPDEIPDYCGLMYVKESCTFPWIIKRPPKLHRDKITLTQTRRLLKSLHSKYWRNNAGNK